MGAESGSFRPPVDVMKIVWRAYRKRAPKAIWLTAALTLVVSLVIGLAATMVVVLPLRAMWLLPDDPRLWDWPMAARIAWSALVIAASIYAMGQGFMLGTYLVELFIVAPRGVTNGKWPPVCAFCKYDLSGTDAAADWWRCPECGKETPTRVRVALARRYVWWVSVVTPHPDLQRHDAEEAGPEGRG